MISIGDRVSVVGFEEVYTVTDLFREKKKVVVVNDDGNVFYIPEEILEVNHPPEPSGNSIIKTSNGYFYYRDPDGFWYSVSKFGRVGRTFEELLAFEGTTEFEVIYDGGK